MSGNWRKSNAKSFRIRGGDGKRQFISLGVLWAGKNFAPNITMLGVAVSKRWTLGSRY
jgi:hypothetical protein